MATTYGFVYAICNECMPGIYKIGFTTNHPMARVEDLSRATACPMPFKLLAYFGCADPLGVEREIHKTFDEFRVNQSREFFRLEPEVLQNEFRGWVGEDAFYSEPLDILCWERKLESDPELRKEVNETVDFIANNGVLQ